METENKRNLIVSKSLLIVTGILEYDQAFIKKLSSTAYISEKESVTEVQKKFYKDYFYPEFRNIMFLQNEDFSAKIFTKSFDDSVSFSRNNRSGELIWHAIKIVKSEIFLFPDGSGLFSIHFNPGDNCKLSTLSDLVDLSRNFNSLIKEQEASENWVNYVERKILGGHLLRGEKITVDDYSGTKFKSYLVVDFQETISQEVRSELLYDLGCGVPIGSAGGVENFSPSKGYYDTLMTNTISVFNTWESLPLFDSFTVAGNSLLDDNSEYGKLATWNKTYFRIYLFNLYFKFSLFRYNSVVHRGTVKVRDDFEKFINSYNISHISFNFLPNLIFQQHNKALETNEELEKFQERINRLSEAIQEEEQKRSNLLLSIVGVLTSLNSIDPVLEYTEKTKQWLNWHPAAFYSVFSILVLGLGLPLLAFLFPEKWKSIKRWWRERNS